MDEDGDRVIKSFEKGCSRDKRPLGLPSYLKWYLDVTDIEVDILGISDTLINKNANIILNLNKKLHCTFPHALWRGSTFLLFSESVLIRNWSSSSSLPHIPKISKVEGTYADKLLASISGMISRNGGRPMVQILKKFLSPLVRSWSGGRIRILYLFSVRLYQLRKKSGVKFLTQYLKTGSILLQQAYGGMKVEDMTSLGPKVGRSRVGYPRIIPARDRAYIRAGNRTVLRIWLTLFSIYRVLSWTQKVKPRHFRTIVDPPTVDLTSVLEEFEQFARDQFYRFIPSRNNALSKASLQRNILNEVPWHNKFMESLTLEFFELAKSSPTAGKSVSSNPVAIANAAATWLSPRFKDLYASFRDWLILSGGEPVPQRTGQVSYNNLNLLMERMAEEGTPFPYLGRLGLKKEPAGKIRVFAMVDCWTQWAMRPLQDQIFKVLRTIPQDGTFDQLAPVKRLLKSDGEFFSYDLSSATDRLPVRLQEYLLRPVLGTVGAELWRKILTDRSYELPHKNFVVERRGFVSDINDENLNYDTASRYNDVKYAVGQPMGALSSWAMLALTHHAIVQWASYLVNKTGWGSNRWFKDYAILGDDIVIKNAAVASKYLEILGRLGVKVNLSKSLISRKKRVCEFAKKYFTPKDSSPVPFSETAAALSSVMALSEFVVKYKPTWAMIFRMEGFGYKQLGNIYKPLSSLSAKARLITLVLTHPDGAFGRTVTNWLGMVSLRRSVPLRSSYWWYFQEECLKKILDKDLSNLQKERVLLKAFLVSPCETPWLLGLFPEISRWVRSRLIQDVVMYRMFYQHLGRDVRKQYVLYDRLLSEFWTAKTTDASLYYKYKELEDLIEQIPPLKDLGQRVDAYARIPKFAALSLKTNSLPFLDRSYQEKAEIRQPSSHVSFGAGFIMVK